MTDDEKLAEATKRIVDASHFLESKKKARAKLEDRISSFDKLMHENRSILMGGLQASDSALVYAENGLAKASAEMRQQLNRIDRELHNEQFQDPEEL